MIKILINNEQFLLFMITSNRVKKNDCKNIIICINRENVGLAIKKKSFLLNYLYKYQIPVHNMTLFDTYFYDFNILIKN